MTDVIGKLLQDNNMPDTPTARAIYKKMLEPDGAAPLTLNGVALYPRREWQGLTDEDVNRESAMIAQKMKLAFHAGMYVAQQVLKEKNT